MTTPPIAPATVSLLVALAFASTALAQPAPAAPAEAALTARYSQKTLLKNWTLSVCLALIAKDARARDDANATASAYLEQGRQRVEDYEALRKLAESFVQRRYAGSIASDFETMKCIDLFHSKRLDSLATRLARPR